MTLEKSTAIKGALLAWVAVIIYASSNSIVVILTNIGGEHLVDGRNAITFCNLLFLGSLFSLVPMVFLFWREWTGENLKALKKSDWISMSISAVLSSALTPSLYFYALDFSSVTNIVLIGRIEPPLMLILSAVVLKEVFDRWAFAGAAIALIGAVVMITMRNNTGGEFTFGKGELAALFAVMSFITSTLLTKAKLKEIPFGIFTIYRTILGTIIYFTVAMYLYGAHHFEDVFAPVVLKWTLVYAFIVIIGGQFAFNLALKTAKTGDMSLATSFSPVAAITIATLLVGEDPGDGLYIGGSIIIAGILLAQYARKRKERIARLAEEDALVHESSVNFKGA